MATMTKVPPLNICQMEAGTINKPANCKQVAQKSHMAGIAK